MKRPGFFNGVLVALVLALVAGAAFAGLGALFSSGVVLPLIVTGLAGAYVCYLLSRSGVRTGRLASMVVWSGAAFVGWLFAPNLALLLCLHMVMIWLLRVLHFHTGVLTALADLGLSCLALACAVWAAQQSGSLFMAVWCFFLVQALFVAIPQSFSAEPDPQRREDSEVFQRAYATAQAAVRRIATQR
jgi:hypothetical protein